MAKYRSLQGDTVDLICHRFYGNTDMVEAVLAANPGLADLSFVLPVGTLITLPEASARSASEPVKLWD